MLNNNFSELVKKYKKYRSARRDKVLLSIMGLMAVVGGGFFLITKSDFMMKSFQKTSPESSTEMTKKTVVNDEKNETIVQKRVVDIQEKTVERTKVETPKSQELPDKVYNRTANKIEEENAFKLKVSERKNLYNLLTDDKKQNSYQSAVRIAEFYFEEKNHQQAVIWAVKASKKDPKESRPWLIYAKSKASLGKTKVATKALSIYLKHTESKEIRDLLNTLK